MGNKGDAAVIDAKPTADAELRNQTHDKLTQEVAAVCPDHGQQTQAPASGNTVAEYIKLAERALLSESLDGAADTAANIWQTVKGEFKAITGLPVGDGDAKPKVIIKDNRAVLPKTDRPKPAGECQGDVDAKTPMEVSVYVKSKASDLTLDREIQRIQSGVSGFLNDAEFEKKFGANPQSVDELKKFAAANGLKVGDVDPRSGRVVLSGNVGQFDTAFGCKVQEYKQPDGSVIRAREGSLSVPKDLAQHIDAVFGMDERPQAHTHFRRLPKDAPPPVTPHAAGPEAKPLLPTEVADLYKFPDKTTGKGQAVAIIELGGNPNPDDYAKYYAAHGLKTPNFNIITVDDAKVSPGTANDANGELALDAEVIGAVAPDATQNMIMAPNSDRGFVDAIERAAFPKAGESENQAISISWGMNEKGWSDQGFQEMDAIFKKAYIRGIGVYAASGDDGAKDGASNFQVDFPSSDPFVTASGGTRLIGKDGKIVSETVWNNGENGGSAGGGISEHWPVPDYQKDVKMPENANKTHKPGRGVPDVSGNADPNSGYIIRVDGSEGSIGGTSAVAPLLAALHVRLGEGVGGGKPTMIGNLNPFFYKHGKDGIFNDITSGNNNGYKAGRGWDAASGWGTVKDGNKMLEILKKDIAAHKH